MDSISFKREITSADAGTKVIVAGGKGILHGITINTTSAQVLTLYDDKTATSPSNKFGAIKASIVEQSLEYHVACDLGLVIDVPGSYTGSATVRYQQQ